MRGRESKRAVRGSRPGPKSQGAARLERPALPALAWGDRVFVPQGYEPAYDYPLLVWLPDVSRRFDLGRTMARTSLRNFVAVEPAAGADAEARAWRAIERVRDRHSIHPRRVYLVGLGRGGSDAFRIACRAPEAFGGVVSLGGPFPFDEGLFAAAGRVRRLPMLLCLRRDAVDAEPAPVDRVLRLFHAAGASLSLRIYPCGEDAAPGRVPRGRSVDPSPAMLADVNRWLMQDVCGATATEPAWCAP